MSWSVNVTGKSHEIAIAFDEQRKQSQEAGMVADEAWDISEAGTFAEGLAATHEETMSVSASGHWVTPADGAPRFGRVSITVERVES